MAKYDWETICVPRAPLRLRFNFHQDFPMQKAHFHKWLPKKISRESQELWRNSYIVLSNKYTAFKINGHYGAHSAADGNSGEIRYALMRVPKLPPTFKIPLRLILNHSQIIREPENMPYYRVRKIGRLRVELFLISCPWKSFRP